MQGLLPTFQPPIFSSQDPRIEGPTHPRQEHRVQAERNAGPAQETKENPIANPIFLNKGRCFVFLFGYMILVSGIYAATLALLKSSRTFHHVRNARNLTTIRKYVVFSCHAQVAVVRFAMIVVIVVIVAG